MQTILVKDVLHLIAHVITGESFVVCSVVLRNYMAHVAIDDAQKGDYAEVRRVLALLQRPFDDCPTASDSDVTSGHVTPGESSSSLSIPASHVTHIQLAACRRS